ncbi:GGDEF domain-containing protein [Butyrivibrio sp. MC2021]|uniref:GGDEF domain-containing protein n=1 Tax=Butyrivibrio sp. MC2021 TaxID=1408306 RepID=UPI000479912F|nr:GGDEF domain-containing protein [Butyrivibrio sp. MC2021]
MRKTVSFLSASIAIIAIVMFLLHRLLVFVPEHPITILKNGWTVTYHNEQYINTNLEKLSTKVGSSFSRGDTITLTYANPLNAPNVPFPYLFFKTQYSAYEVYLDDTLIAKEYKEALRENTFVGMGYNKVALPTDFKNQTLSIRLSVVENDTSSNLLSPMIGDFDDLYRYNLSTVYIPLFTGVFLIIFGQVFLSISLLFYTKSSGVSTQVICSLLNILIGVWIITAYECAEILVTNAFSTFAEHVAQFLMVPLTYLLIYDLHKRYNNKVIIILGIASLSFSTLFIVLHIFGIVHIHHFQSPYLGMSAISIIIIASYEYTDVKNKIKNPSTRTLMAGVCVLTLMFLIFAIISSLHIYIDYRQNIILVLLPLGAMFFAVVQLLNYFIFMTHAFSQKREYASLRQIAYADNLTGLPNRASCDKKFLEFNNSDKDYCILSLDLNGLKEVNDNAGHPAGDRLLKAFAEALSSTFSDIGFCCRIGGDEFLVLMEDVDKEVLEKRLDALKQRLDELDKEDPEVNHSTSYGYAYNSEVKEEDTHSVFILADKRMYDYKRRYYSHMMTR